jgi:hypothetical protein
MLYLYFILFEIVESSHSDGYGYMVLGIVGLGIKFVLIKFVGNFYFLIAITTGSFNPAALSFELIYFHVRVFFKAKI